MNTLTLDEALALVHPWLGHTPETCKVTGGLAGKLWCCAQYGWWAVETPPPPHTRPMPPAGDALAMQVLRKWTADRVTYRITHMFLIGRHLFTFDFERGPVLDIQVDDPRDAIILAAGEWLKTQQK